MYLAYLSFEITVKIDRPSYLIMLESRENDLWTYKPFETIQVK